MFNIKYFHTLDADDPFFDPISIKRSLELCNKGYDIVHPSKVSKEGGASEGWSFSRKAIKTVYKYLLKFGKKMDTFDTEIIETFFCSIFNFTFLASKSKFLKEGSKA